MEAQAWHESVEELSFPEASVEAIADFGEIGLVEMFVGKLDPTKLGFFERLGATASDNRNWDAIRAWANALAAQLQRAEMLIPA